MSRGSYPTGTEQDMFTVTVSLRTWAPGGTGGYQERIEVGRMERGGQLWTILLCSGPWGFSVLVRPKHRGVGTEWFESWSPRFELGSPCPEGYGTRTVLVSSDRHTRDAGVPPLRRWFTSCPFEPYTEGPRPPHASLSEEPEPHSHRGPSPQPRVTFRVTLQVPPQRDVTVSPVPENFPGSLSTYLPVCRGPLGGASEPVGGRSRRRPVRPAPLVVVATTAFSVCRPPDGPH